MLVCLTDSPSLGCMCVQCCVFVVRAVPLLLQWVFSRAGVCVYVAPETRGRTCLCTVLFAALLVKFCHRNRALGGD